MVTFKELWLMTPEGAMLFHLNKVQDTINPNLFTGFFSAIYMMSEESIEAINMKESKIMILPVKEPIRMYVIARCAAKDKDKDIKKELAKIRDLFLASYSEILKNWDGNVSQFEPFASKIKI
jgi:hypothetical protein